MNEEAALLDMPVGICGPDRDAYIIDHASYFTVAFRVGYDKQAVPYNDLETTLSKAAAAANYLKRNVLIYAVLGPFQAYVGAVHYNNGELVFVPNRGGKVKELKND